MGIEQLVGKTLTSVTGLENGSERVMFRCSDGALYEMTHDQRCCEDVEVSDIVGDPSDMRGVVFDAREETSGDLETLTDQDLSTTASWTWTFYVIQTEYGAVTIRWLGTSNGCYSETVEFRRVV